MAVFITRRYYNYFFFHKFAAVFVLFVPVGIFVGAIKFSHRYTFGQKTAFK